MKISITSGPDLLKLFCSDIQNGSLGSHCKILQNESSLNVWQIKLNLGSSPHDNIEIHNCYNCFWSAIQHGRHGIAILFWYVPTSPMLHKNSQADMLIYL